MSNEKISNSNLKLFSMGKFISIFGTSIYTFTMGLYVLEVTGSALGFSTNLILSTIPMIVISPFAGVIADKFDKKKIIVLTDLLNGLFMIGIYLLLIKESLSVELIYFSTVVITILTTIFDCSMESAKPDLVEDKDILKINSISKVIDSLSRMLGPFIGGVVFVLFDIKSFILFNGISFIISAIIEVFMKFNCKRGKKQVPNKYSFKGDIVDGIKYLIKQKGIIRLLFIFILYNFTIALSITIPIPYILNNVLEVGSVAYGIIQGALPVGMILGAIIIKGLIDSLNEEDIFLKTGRVLAILMFAISSPILLVEISVHNLMYVLVYLVIIFILGICISIIDIPFSYIMQTKIVEEYRARSLSIVICLIKMIVPISYAISGILIEVLNPFVISIIGGCITLLGNKIYKKNFVLH